MYLFLTGRNIWPDGWTKLRVYFVPKVEEIRPLVEVYGEVFARYDFVSAQPLEWMHETVAVLEGRPASSVTRPELDAVEALLRERIAALPVFTVNAGGALASRHGVVLDLTPDEPFMELQRRARGAIADIFGQQAATFTYEGGRPHIAVAYGTGTGDSGLLQGDLRNATGLRVALTVADVCLVDVTQDVQRHQYRWRELARIPLGARP